MEHWKINCPLVHEYIKDLSKTKCQLGIGTFKIVMVHYSINIS